MAISVPKKIKKKLKKIIETIFFWKIVPLLAKKALQLLTMTFFGPREVEFCDGAHTHTHK